MHVKRTMGIFLRKSTNVYEKDQDSYSQIRQPLRAMMEWLLRIQKQKKTPLNIQWHFLRTTSPK
ncbi:MAG: hypothetical protein ACI828_002758 [Flavobacteriales bacterium]|jgi:hypothetical protein